MFYCPACIKEVTPDHEDLIDCLPELTVVKELCTGNDKVVITVESHQSLKLSLVTTSEVLQTCYGKHEKIKQFAKAISTTPVNINYNNDELKILRI